MSFTLFTFIDGGGSQNPVEVSLFIDGVNVAGGETITLAVADGSHEVAAYAFPDGYAPAIERIDFPKSTVIMILNRAVQTDIRVPFTLSVSPSTAVGVSYTYNKLGGGDSVIGVVDTQPVSSLLKDTKYNLTVSADGYSNTSLAVDTELTNNASVSLSLLTDSVSQAQNVQPTGALVDVGGNPIATRNALLTPPEFVYPNSVDGKYFTTTQARIYIGNVFIDEINWVQFALQDNKVPIYGYRSRYFDAMAQGKSLVQGQLGINFVSEGYLWTVLSEYDRLAAGDIQFDDPVSQQVAEVSNLEDSVQTVDVVARKKDMLTQLPPSAVDKVKQRRVAKANKSLIGYTNALYLDVPFDLQIELEGGGRTVSRRLEDCFLVANEQVLDQSGTSLIDGYSFIARRLR